MIQISQNKIPQLWEISDNVTTLDYQNESQLSQASNLSMQFNPAIGLLPVFKATVKKVLDNGGEIFLYQNSHKTNIHGMLACAYLSDQDSQKSMYVDTLFVDPQFQGKGYAKDLVTSLLVSAVSNEVKNIFWETGKNRTEAQNLYASLKIPVEGIEWRYQPNSLSQVLTFLPTILGNNGGDLGDLFKNLFRKQN